MKDRLPPKDTCVQYLNIASSACSAAAAAGLIPKQPVHKATALAGLVLTNCYIVAQGFLPEIKCISADKCAAGITFASAAVLNAPAMVKTASLAQRFKALCFIGAGACNAGKTNLGLTVPDAAPAFTQCMAGIAQGVTAFQAAEERKPLGMVAAHGGSGATKALSAVIQSVPLR